MSASPPLMAEAVNVDKLSHEIFSILESKFLFGYDDPSKLLFPANTNHSNSPSAGVSPRSPAAAAGRVCVLSIDGGGRAADGLLAGAALVRLESSLRRRSGDPAARIADFFDVAAGSGAGGVLAAMLVTRSPHGRPLFSAQEAMAFLIQNLRHSWANAGGRRRSFFRRSGAGVFTKVFGDLTLKDTVKPLLMPCYDLSTGAPFLFSRADAVQSSAFNFKLRDACAATCAGVDGAVETKSVDSATRLLAVGGGVSLGNPTAAAMTHVLNNKREFPLAAGVENLLVVSIGSADVTPAGLNCGSSSSSSAEIVRIAAEGVADMVDQAVAMAFGHSRASNYIRIQAVGSSTPRPGRKGGIGAGEAEEMLAQKNVESVLFRGKKLAEQTNAEKLEWFAHELLKEHDRRKAAAPAAAAAPPPAALKKPPPPPSTQPPPRP